MILTFPEVISADEQRAILAEIAAAEFVSGRETAGAALAWSTERTSTPR